MLALAGKDGASIWSGRRSGGSRPRAPNGVFTAAPTPCAPTWFCVPFQRL